MKMICSKTFRLCATSLLSISATVFLVLALAAFSVRSVAAEGDDDQAYVISASNQFGIVNVETGDFSLIGNTTSTLSGLGQVHGVLYGLDAANNLVTVNPANANTTVVGNIGLPPSGQNVTLLASLGHRLYVVDPNNNLYRINPSTGAATLVGSTGIPAPDPNTCGCVTANSLAGGEGDLFFTWQVNDDTNGHVLVPSTLYHIDTRTGHATAIGLTHSSGPIVGAGFVGDELYGFTFGLPVNLPNQILELDTETGEAEFVADQSASLDPVFGASDVRSLRHHHGNEH
jgi:hypothetical protein